MCLLLWGSQGSCKAEHKERWSSTYDVSIPEEVIKSCPSSITGCSVSKGWGRTALFIIPCLSVLLML